MSQYLNIVSPSLKLCNQSWTFEAWILIKYITSANEFVIIGQCKSTVNDECLHLLVKDKHLFFGTWYDDLTGNTTLGTSRWYHVAFTFDCDTRTQSIYLDGVIDGSRQANACFQGHSQSVTIGAVDVHVPERFFNGLIDQLSFTDRPKSSEEILQDATLTLYFSFNNDSIYDQGPLRINGSLAGNTTFIAGRVGKALEIRNVNQSYFQVQGLVLLGTTDHPYSFSIWIRPNLQQQSSVIHLSSSENGTGVCLPILGLTDTSQLVSYSWNGTSVSVTGPVIPLNSWTHVAITYSSGNGLRLHVNGTLRNSLVPFSFSSAGTPMYLLIGSPNLGVTCGSALNVNGQYSGAVDEFQVYSRELSTVDIATLATQ